MDPNNFQEALQRVRQLAAKMHAPPQPNAANPTKRPFEDDDFEPESAKRPSFEPSDMNQRPQRGQRYLNGIVFNGEKTLDVMIPGNKVGFVIGKGGEMIRTLQDKAGVKMVFNQETNEPTEHEKPLRITGPPDKVDYGKQLVMDLLLEKEMEAANRQRGGVGLGGGDRDNRNFSRNFENRPPSSEYGGASSRMTFFEYPVPPQMIGLIIGKGGETIRKIQADSSCKVQFDTAKLDSRGNKICQFTGTKEAVDKAVEMVKEIIDTMSTGGGGGGGGGPGGAIYGPEEMRLIVPASRTGSVIGRGGENIRALKQQSGCSIELDKSFNSEQDEKCFILRGTAEKVTHAQQLVTDKVGGPVTVLSCTFQSNFNSQGHEGPYGGNYHQAANQMYMNQAAAGQGPSSSSAAPYYWQQSGDANGKSAQQDVQAMWAAYYAQYYSQMQAGGAAAATASADQQQQAAGAAGDEAVYQQWVDYYKAYGMTKEADEMEQKLKELQNAKKKSDDANRNGSRNQNGHSE